MSFPFTTNNFFGNPWAGSALASFGLQQRKSAINFSVGVAAPTGDAYVKKDKNGDMPVASIEDGYVEFSVAQSHPYLGIGDKVILDDGGGGITIYLNEKVSTRRWKVRNQYGDTPPNISTALPVVTIDKAFNSVYDAINGDTSGAYTLLGGISTAHNLIAKKAMLQIVCYEMYDNLGANTVSISGNWFISEEYRVRVFVPSDISRECNKKQAYRVSSSSNILNMSGAYNIIDGLIMGDAGHTPGYAIRINSSNNYTQIINNTIFGATIGIEVDSPEADEFVITSNVVRDCGDGIVLGTAAASGGACYNNTVVNSTTDGILYSGNNLHKIYNNIVQDSGNMDINSSGAGYSNVYNCITGDGSAASGTDCHTITLKFEDKAGDDYRLNLIDTDAYMSGAGFDLSEDLRYAFSRDIDGGEIDNTWCIGAYHYVREATFAVGPNLELKVGTPTYSVTDSVMTFSEPQTHELMCAGCRVSEWAGPLTRYFLKRKISDTEWVVNNGDGSPIADIAGPVTIEEIRFLESDLYNMFLNGSGVEDEVTNDLVSADIRAKVTCSGGITDRTTSIGSSWDCDKNRNIVIFSPDMSNPDYIESNTNRRHNGKWDTLDYIPVVTDPHWSYCNANGYRPHTISSPIDHRGITIQAPYVVIDGLQLTGCRIQAYQDMSAVTIKNNIIKDCDEGAGIEVGAFGKVETSFITNNIIYNGAGPGIEIIHGTGFRDSLNAVVGTFGDNAVYLFNPGFTNDHIYMKYTVAVQAGVEDKIEWLSGRVIFTASPGASFEDIINSGNVSGTPWSELIPTGSNPADILTATRLEDFPPFFPMNLEEGFGTVHYIYNNTIIGCDRGIVVDTIPSEDSFTNSALLRNNLVLECENESYYSTSSLTTTILAEYNWSDDQSINNFFGSHNQSTAALRFVEPESKDYRFTLHDLEHMDGLNLASDEFFPVTHDNAGTEYESMPYWVAGANTWTFRNKEYHCSIGNEATDLSPTIDSVTVVDGILEFDTAPSSAIGVGDRITYDDGGPTYGYLAEKGTALRWCAVDASGNQLADMTSKTVTSINRVSLSIETALSTDIVAEFLDIGDKNLVADAVSVYAWCYNDNDLVDDINVADVSGWTQSFSYRLHLQTPWDIQTQCMTKQRHDGVWGGYRITSAFAAVTLDINDNYTIIRGLCVEHTNGGKAIASTNVSGIVVENNIIRDSGVGIEIDSVPFTYDRRNRAMGNIVYDCTTGIIVEWGKVFNNTVVGGTDGIVTAQASDILTNNICQDQSNSCFSGPAQINSTTSIASDTTAWTISNPRGGLNNVNLVFVDKAGKDFHLHRNDWHAINRGVDLGTTILPIIDYSTVEVFPYHDDSPFYRDIDNETIDSDKWSIGSDVIADIETIDLFFSYAENDVTNYREGVTPTMAITGGVATFSIAQDNPGMGIGDKVDYDADNKICYLYSKTSETEWAVRDKFGLAPSDIVDVDLNSITRAFSDKIAVLFDKTDTDSIPWFLGNSSNQFLHLRTGKYRLNIATFKTVNAPAENPMEIRYFDADAEHYVRLFTPTNELTECNQSQSHLGKNESVTTEKSFFQSAAADVVSLYVPYTVIDGLIFTGDEPSDRSALMLYNTHDCKFVNNIMFSGYYGIGLADMGHDDFTGDNFDGYQIRDDGYWHADFNDTDRWRVRFVPDVGYVAYAKEWTSINPTTLTEPAELKSGDFDIEIGIVPGGDLNAITHFTLTDGATRAQLAWRMDLKEIDFAGTKLYFPFVPDREYRFRIVRGGELTSDGIYSNSPGDDLTQLYYFDNFNDGDGTGTNEWVKFPGGSYDGWDGDYWLTIKAEKGHGFSYISMWNEGDATPAKTIGRNANNIIVNNTIYGSEIDGIKTTGSDILYNNTLSEAGGYCYNNEPTDVMMNNIGQLGSTLDFKDGTTAEYCVSSDESLTVTDDNKNITDQELTFVDNFSNMFERDYHLVFTDGSAVWTAARLDRNVDYPFNFDGGGTPRLRKWDRGALEYQSNKVVYAVGYSSDDYQTKPAFGALVYAIDAINGRSVLTFSTPQINEGLGIGCKIVDNAFPFAHGCVLTEKITTSKWVVADYYGAPIVSKPSGEVISIQRVFSDLEDAFQEFMGSSYLNNANLRAVGVYVVFAIYNDEPGRSSILDARLGGCLSYAHHNVKITVPYNTDTECNLSQRHDSIYGDGYKLEPEVYNYEPKAAIAIYQSAYIEIEGLQISAAGPIAHGIYLNSCTHSFIGYNIIKGCSGNGVLSEAFVIQGGPHYVDDIINNLVYDCEGNGIEMVPAAAPITINVNITNNTIFNCRRGIFLNKADYDYPGSSWIPGDGLSVVVSNTICVESKYQDFVSNYENHWGRLSLNSCVSGDASSWMFPGNDNVKNGYISFVSRASKNFNLSKFKDGLAVDSAIDFSYDYRHPFFDDNTKDPRDFGEFDRGAFEVVDLIGNGDMGIGPVTMGGIGIESLIFPTTILYLREPGPGIEGQDDNFLPHISPSVQFARIEGTDPLYDINKYLEDRLKTDHIIIYMQGGKAFTGTFQLQDRDTREVHIETYPPEASDGPASHIYIGPIVDDVSDQGLLTYKNVKVYSNPYSAQTYLLDETANTKALRLINSIVQVNAESLIGGNAGASVNVTNSIIVYRRGGPEEAPPPPGP